MTHWTPTPDPERDDESPDLAIWRLYNTPALPAGLTIQEEQPAMTSETETLDTPAFTAGRTFQIGTSRETEARVDVHRDYKNVMLCMYAPHMSMNLHMTPAGALRLRDELTAALERLA